MGALCPARLDGSIRIYHLPCGHGMFIAWFPARERTKLIAISNVGPVFGSAVAFALSGVLVDLKDDANGHSASWPLVFYVFGGVGIAWSAAWALLIYSDPTVHPTISQEEKEYLLHSTKADADVTVEQVQVTKSASAPWMGFLCTPDAWVVYLNHFAANYGNYTMMTYLPKFFSEQLHFDLGAAGVISVIPNLCSFISAIAAGWLGDLMIRTRFSVRTTRLISMTVSFVFGGAFVVLAAYVRSRLLAVLMISLSFLFTGVQSAGCSPAYLDLSPYYASAMYGVGNTVANVAGLLAPAVAGQFLGGKSTDATRADWQKVFYTNFACYLAALALWCSCMKGKPLQRLN